MKDKYFKEQLNALRLDILYLNSYQSVIILIILSSLISVFYRGEYGEPYYEPLAYSVWLPSSIAVYIFKLFCSVIYRKRILKPGNNNFWRYLFYATTAMTGISISFSTLFVTTMSNETEKMFILLLVGAVCSGSVSILATSLMSFIIFNSLALLPYSVYFMFSDLPEYRMTGYFIILFISTLTVTAYRISNSLGRSLSLKIENDIIIEKLSQSEEKFSKSFYSGIAPMAMINYNDARIVDANNAMLELLEYTRDEVIGKNPYELNLNDRPEDVIDVILEASETGHLSNRRITLKTRNGAVKHCLVTIESFKVNDTTIAFIMLQDFTERRTYEKKLEFERDRAEQAASAKTKFLASMSHEIRTPMNTVLGMTGLALVTDDPAERKEYLETVKDSAEYLLALINDILDLSKIEAGKVVIEVIDIDLKKLTESVYRVMAIHAQNKKLQFIINIDSSLPDYIRSSPERLKQILINLIGNAIKFTPAGSVTLHVSRSDGTGYSHSTDIKEFIEFFVSDTGIGIPEDKFEEIFESFTQADSSIFRKYGGTGLGLSISRQIIKLMRGDIILKSRVNEGSTFSFIIPLTEGTKPDVSDTGIQATACSDIKRVLVAEDNLLNQKLISAYMKKLGHEFTIAENGESVIDTLKSSCFDVVLMDLEMPVLDGYETMRRIRNGSAGEDNRNIIIHAMSAHVMKTTIEKCLSEGFNGYITKPVDLKKLGTIL